MTNEKHLRKSIVSSPNNNFYQIWHTHDTRSEWYLNIFNKSCLSQPVNKYALLKESFLLTNFSVSHFPLVLQCKNRKTYWQCIKKSKLMTQIKFLSWTLFTAITWFNNSKQLLLFSKGTSTVSFPNF